MRSPLSYTQCECCGQEVLQLHTKLFAPYLEPINAKWEGKHFLGTVLICQECFLSNTLV